jgi:hypothetical protein
MLFKLGLAVIALVSAIISILDLPSLNKDHKQRRIFKKLSIWGYTKVGAAVCTFLLIAIIESRSQKSSANARASEEALRATVSQQTVDLTEARSALARLVDESVTFRQSFNLFERAIRTVYVYYKTVSLQFDGRVNYALDYAPKENDRIDWRINCFTQSLPEVGSCRSGSFGYLIANGEKTPLVSFTGS